MRYPQTRFQRTLMSDILRFNTNTPVEVALRWEDGREVEGRYGLQVMYTLADQRVIYVPPIVAQQIRELGSGRVSASRSARRKPGRAERRWIEWQVRRLESPQQPTSSGNGYGCRGMGSKQSPEPRQW